MKHQIVLPACLLLWTLTGKSVAGNLLLLNYLRISVVIYLSIYIYAYSYINIYCIHVQTSELFNRMPALPW